MCKYCSVFIAGCVVGMVVAFVYEDEMYEGLHCVDRAQRKMMRKMRQVTK